MRLRFSCLVPCLFASLYPAFTQGPLDKSAGFSVFALYASTLGAPVVKPRATLPQAESERQESAEAMSRVVQRIRIMLKETGRVTFSRLYNTPDLTEAEREALARLYEAFFGLPDFILRHARSTGSVPSLAILSQRFSLPPEVIGLLLDVMVSDPRVPPLLERDESTGEITEIHEENLEKFLQRHGSAVRMAGWEGRPLPPFQCTTLDGRLYSVDKLKGKPALLYFWFTGCPPCVRMSPVLAELFGTYDPKGVQFVGFNADDFLNLGVDPEVRRRYLTEHRLSFPQLTLDRATWEAFGSIQGYPTLFLVNSEGVVVRHLVDYQDRSTLEALLEDLIE